MRHNEEEGGIGGSIYLGHKTVSGTGRVWTTTFCFLPPSLLPPSLSSSILSLLHMFHSLTPLFPFLLPSPPSLPVNIDATEGVEYVEEEEVVQEAGK